jgi:hypothetical protein
MWAFFKACKEIYVHFLSCDKKRTKETHRLNRRRGLVLLVQQTGLIGYAKYYKRTPL